MWGALISFIGFIVKKLFGAAPAVRPEQQLGQAQSQVAQEEDANDQLQAAARARADADAHRVRDDPRGAQVNTDPGAAVNDDPDAHFRD
jgi:hypothetical protein